MNTQNKKRRILTLEEELLVCQIYKQTGRAKDCQVALKTRQETIRECLKKYGLYRAQREAVINSPQNQRKYNVNDSFFDIETSDMAYILGILASDGSVSKRENEIKLSFSSVDRDFLVSLREKIGGRPIKDYTTQKGFEVSSWSFTSQHIKEKLSEYNIIPAKTFTFKFPTKLSKKYWKDFIRGYFDGDGSISTAGSYSIRFQICSATKDVLEKTVDFFEENGVPRTSILEQTKNRKSPLYYIQYSSVPTRMIYNILYYENCLCLSRKKQKFEEILFKKSKEIDSQETIYPLCEDNEIC